MNQIAMNQYAPCPKCGATNAEKMSFTWWGGLIGPRILTHVKCRTCATTFNGKTGKDNTNGIIIYCVVVGVVILFIFAIAIIFITAIMIGITAG